MTRHLACILTLGISFLGIAAAPLSAASIEFNNFGPGTTFDTGNGNPIGNGFDGNDYAEANSFVASFTGTFQSLTIALSCVFGCPDPVTVSLASNTGGVPGVALETFVVPGGSLGAFGTSFSPVVLNSVLHPTLVQNATYWITAAAGLNDVAAWNLNTIGDLSSQAISSDNAVTWFAPSGNTPGAMSVSADSPVSATPEPGSLLLMAGGALLLAFRARQSVA